MNVLLYFVFSALAIWSAVQAVDEFYSVQLDAKVIAFLYGFTASFCIVCAVEMIS